MNQATEAVVGPNVAELARRAKAAARQLAAVPGERRNAALKAAAYAIEECKSDIINANQRDCDDAIRAVKAGRMSQALFERLQLTERGIAQMATGVRKVASLADPLGRKLAVTELDDGLTLSKESCPLGVIGIIFEARPEIVPQIAALALKSGNALILKGGVEAVNSNRALTSIWRHALAPFFEIPADAINLLYTRAEVDELLSLADDIDLIIPRGSREFVRYVAEHSKIPVLGHGEGICHVYVDCAADPHQALEIALDSKVQYPAACNSMETLLVHEEIAPLFLPNMIPRFQAAGVEVRGCPRTLALVPMRGIVPAGEEDWATEYSDLIISIKIVASTDEAIAHIDRYGSGHTDAIITENGEAASHFMERVDSAGVYHNASTRFADGFRYGFGAELGISTSKLHARGPVGLEGLTTYKYKLAGHGHVVASYSKGEREFKHKRSNQ
ncbi:MAG: glutamate-5-semialdehyde dehydrogenase [Cyanobacteria bacterium 13_1_40CM_2_61_4]|nr:MAG: glutamate-5-semialdehyde dehydrogenase [Cyanobacteria bacterium 13_1_40CM_2_61_4]